MTMLLEIFQFDFMVRALIAGMTIGIVAPLIGTFLVVRRYSLMADTLAHVSLVGVAIGVLTRTQPVIVAMLTSVLAAIGVEMLRRRRGLFAESLLALVLSSSLAIASVIMSLANGFNTNLLSFLFGSITTVQPADVLVILLLGVGVFVTILLLYKEFFAVAFDEELAQTSGLPAHALSTALVVLAAVTVALAMRIVGVLLIGALMVIPVMAAMQWGRSFRETIALAVLFSLLSVIVGIAVSYAFALATGGTIVVVALVLFLGSVLTRRSV